MATRKTTKTAKPVRTRPQEDITRRRGRPPVNGNGLLDRKFIIACAFEMSKTVPLQELSIVKVARELGVTPPLIHYYLDGRDALTSGIMNSFFQELQREWPAATGQWREDIDTVCHYIYRRLVTYAGVAAYMVAHNRFRLVQLGTHGEPDYGIILFERFVGVMRQAGFDPRRTGMYANLLMEQIVSAAYATVRHRWPGDHGSVLERAFAKLDPKEFPNTHFVRKDFVHFSDDAAFADGMNLTLNGLDLERSRLQADTGKTSRRRKAS